MACAVLVRDGKGGDGGVGPKAPNAAGTLGAIAGSIKPPGSLTYQSLTNVAVNGAVSSFPSNEMVNVLPEIL